MPFTDANLFFVYDCLKNKDDGPPAAYNLKVNTARMRFIRLEKLIIKARSTDSDVAGTVVGGDSDNAAGVEGSDKAGNADEGKEKGGDLKRKRAEEDVDDGKNDEGEALREGEVVVKKEEQETT